MRTEYLNIVKGEPNSQELTVSGKGPQWDERYKDCSAEVRLTNLYTDGDNIHGILTSYTKNKPWMRVYIKIDDNIKYDTGYKGEGTYYEFPRYPGSSEDFIINIPGLKTQPGFTLTLAIRVSRNDIDTNTVSYTYTKYTQKWCKCEFLDQELKNYSRDIKQYEFLKLSDYVKEIEDSKTGYNFRGWLVKIGQAGGSSQYTDDTIQIINDTTFTAKWEQIKSKLTLNPNNGLINGKSENEELTVIYDSSDYNNLSEYKLSRSGYKFLGWYDIGGNQIYDANGNYIKKDNPYWTETGTCKTTQAFTLYAQWEIQNIAYVLDIDNNNNKKWNLALTYVFIDNNDIKGWKPAIIYILNNNIWQQSIADAGFE